MANQAVSPRTAVVAKAPNVGLRRLLAIHAAVTLAAGVVLVIAPATIPGMVGIDLADDVFLVAYLLAGAEFGFAYLSFFARRLRDVPALLLVVRTLITFHGSTGVLEAYAFTQGVSPVIWGNVALRVVIIGALWQWGVRRLPDLSGETR